MKLYRGIRPAAGYPACPDHTEKQILFDLLAAEENAKIQLTESFAMWPGASVSGLYFGHPEAKYFGVGKIDKDQVLDYQRRKEMPLEEIERWLGPYLTYEPKATKLQKVRRGFEQKEAKKTKVIWVGFSSSFRAGDVRQASKLQKV